MADDTLTPSALAELEALAAKASPQPTVTDRRPTRADFTNVLIGICVSTAQGTWGKDILDALDRAGFIKPEPRQAGWYRARRHGHKHWQALLLQTCGAMYTVGGRVDDPTIWEFGARIDMPDDPASE